MDMVNAFVSSSSPHHPISLPTHIWANSDLVVWWTFVKLPAGVMRDVNRPMFCVFPCRDYQFQGSYVTPFPPYTRGTWARTARI